MGAVSARADRRLGLDRAYTPYKLALPLSSAGGGLPSLGAETVGTTSFKVMSWRVPL